MLVAQTRCFEQCCLYGTIFTRAPEPWLATRAPGLGIEGPYIYTDDTRSICFQGKEPEHIRARMVAEQRYSCLHALCV